MKKHKFISGALTLALIGAIGVHEASAATTFTSADVANHATATNCWEVVNGNVYDLTQFITQHSGGSSVIIGQCGKDASAVFASGPHSGTTINALAPYSKGTLVTTPPPTPTPAPVPTPAPTPTTTTSNTNTSKEKTYNRETNERDHSFTREETDSDHEDEESTVSHSSKHEYKELKENNKHENRDHKNKKGHD